MTPLAVIVVRRIDDGVIHATGDGPPLPRIVVWYTCTPQIVATFQVVGDDPPRLVANHDFANVWAEFGWHEVCSVAERHMRAIFGHPLRAATR